MTDNDPTPLTIEDVEAMLLLQNPPVEPWAPFEGDPNATWVYWMPQFDRAGEPVREDWVWERLRLRRNRHLAETDAQVTPDASGDVDAWMTYRQALRDLPQLTDDPTLATWPEPPATTQPNPNRVAVRAAAKDALQRNRDFIASTPTTQTTVAAVKDHARQLNGVIRLLLNQLDATD